MELDHQLNPLQSGAGPSTYPFDVTIIIIASDHLTKAWLLADTIRLVIRICVMIVVAIWPDGGRRCLWSHRRLFPSRWLFVLYLAIIFVPSVILLVLSGPFMTTASSIGWATGSSGGVGSLACTSVFACVTTDIEAEAILVDLRVD